MNPEIAGRSCDDCKQWQYDDAKKVGGKVLLRAGKPLPRGRGQPTPCYRCPKIPPGAPPFAAHAVEWGEKSWRAFRFHQRCKAVGRFPDDAIVIRNAGLIEGALEVIRDGRQQATAEMLINLVQLAVRR